MGLRKKKPRYNVVSFRLADDELVLLTEASVMAKQDKGRLVRELVLAGIRAERGCADAEVR